MNYASLNVERRVVPLREEGEERGLASSRGPHDGQHFSGLAVAFAVVEDGFVLSVGGESLPCEGDFFGGFDGRHINDSIDVIA